MSLLDLKQTITSGPANGGNGGKGVMQGRNSIRQYITPETDRISD
jgi:hypothetical protein